MPLYKMNGVLCCEGCQMGLGAISLSQERQPVLKTLSPAASFSGQTKDICSLSQTEKGYLLGVLSYGALAIWGADL